MTMSEHELREVWRRRSARPAAHRAGCLTEDTFARLMSGEANTDERLRAAQHMATCASCAEEYKLLEPLSEWVDDAILDLAPDAAAGVPMPVGASSPASRSAWPPFSSSQSGWLLAAACVLIAVLGGSLWMLESSSRQRVARLEGALARYEQDLTTMRSEATKLTTELEAQRRQQLTSATSPSVGAAPLLDVPIVDLEREGSGGSRSAGRAQVVTTRADAPAVVLILNFPPLEARTTLRVEIADAKGQTRWSGTSERPRQTASLNLTLPRQAFPPGTYSIRLTLPTKGAPAKGAGTGQDTLAVYPLELR